MAPPEILIVGCGVAGPVLATFLLRKSTPAQQKPHITIIERSSAAHSFGQNIDIREAGVTVIRKLGLETAIRSATTREEGVHFVDENNRVLAINPADKTGSIQTGTSDIEILRGTLSDIVFKRSKEVSDEVKKNGGKGIDYIFGETLELIEQDGEKVQVTFSKSHQTRKYDLLIGADGLMSTTRRMIFGKETDDSRLHRTGMYGAFFSMPKGPTDSLWRRWFITTRKRNAMIRPSDRPDKSTVLMFVGNDNDERLPRLAKMSYRGIDDQKALVEEYFRDVGWESKRLIKEMYAAEDFYFNMIAQVKMDKWSKGRVVLLGDAAYCPSPFSGRGTTVALEGAYHLAGALTRYPNDYDAAFASYESTMRPIVEKAQKLVPGFTKITAPETIWGVYALRIFAMAVCFVAQLLLPLLSLKAAPKPKAVSIEDYGFEDLEDRPV